MPGTVSSQSATITAYSRIHPLDAPPEQKLFRADIGRMHLTPRVKLVLFALQGYLGVMALLVGWKLIAGT